MILSALVALLPALLLDGVALRHPGVAPARATALRMELSDAEKARAYEEQVARAEAMAKDPSIRPPRKGLFEAPGLSSIFGKKADDSGEGGFDTEGDGGFGDGGFGDAGQGGFGEGGFGESAFGDDGFGGACSPKARPRSRDALLPGSRILTPPLPCVSAEGGQEGGSSSGRASSPCLTVLPPGARRRRR